MIVYDFLPTASADGPRVMTDDPPSSTLRDPARLAALRRTSLLDSPPEPSFDRLARLASRVVKAPAALVTLVDAERQFFKSGLGLPEPWATLRETPLSHSFCRHVVASGAPLVIEDARRHPLVSDCPGIVELGVIAYLGVPLLDPDGHALGSFAAVDREPRAWTPEDVETMRDLAASAMTEIALRLDNAERRRAEEALSVSRERLDLVIRSADLGLWYCDLPFDRLVWDDRCKAHFGLPPAAEVTIDDFYARLHPEDRAPTAEAMGRAIAGHGSYDVVYRTVGPDGRMRWIRAVGRPSYDDAGRPTRFDGITEDVTEQRLAEERIRSLNADLRRRVVELQTLLDVAPVGIALAHDAECRRISANPALAELIGVEPGLNVSKTGPEADRLPYVVLRDGREVPAAELPMQVVAATGVPVLGRELDLRRADGRVAHLFVSAVPLFDEHHRVRGCFAVHVDLTERRRAEEELRRAKEAAEAASRAKDQFLAVLSHELRTPLTPVLVGVTAMLDDPDTPPAVRPTLELARRNVELEARLIDDLLDVTRISRGKLSLGREVVDAHSLIGRAVEICRDEVATGGLALVLGLAAAEYHVEADPARLQQVYWNLIKNAVKFTPPGGTLTIRSRNGPAPDGGPPRLVVQVADTGIGIAPDVLPRIFNAFDQGDASVTRQFGGLGLGLAISRSLAEAHGGSLSAASDGRGRGATFTLELPTVPAPAAVIAGAPTDPSPGRPPSELRILLVEDNADTLRVMARLLRQRGYRVTTADSVRAGLEAAEAARFDLVVSDLGLPDGSGLDLMRRIASWSEARGIALSGFGMDGDVRQSQEAGFVAHLTKPVDFRTLEATILRVASPPA